MKNTLLPLCVLAIAAALMPGCSTPQTGAPAKTDAVQAKIYTSQELDTQPKVAKYTAPKYPFALKTRGIKGEVVLECIIDEKGLTHEIRVVRATNDELAISCIESLKKWKWTPGKKNGLPVACRYQQPFEFDVVD